MLTLRFFSVLDVHSRRWVCLLKDRNGRIYYRKKEDTTVNKNNFHSVTVTVNLKITINSTVICEVPSATDMLIENEIKIEIYD